MKKIFLIAILVFTLLSSFGCGDEKKKDAPVDTTQNVQTSSTQSEPTKVIDEKKVIYEWHTKLDNVAGKYLTDWKALYEPSIQLMSQKGLSQNEVLQNQKTIYQNLNNLSNKLINYEMMFREIRIPNEISSEKQEQLLQIQNLYADGTKKFRESVDVMKLGVMKGNFPESEKNKFVSMQNDGSAMFNEGNNKWQQLEQHLE